MSCLDFLVKTIQYLDRLSPCDHASNLWLASQARSLLVSLLRDSQISCLKMRVPLAKLTQQQAQKELELVVFIVFSPSVLTTSNYSCQFLPNWNRFEQQWTVRNKSMDSESEGLLSQVLYHPVQTRTMSSAPCCILFVWSPINVRTIRPSVRASLPTCVRTYACMHGCMDGWMHGCMHACMNAWMDARMHGWMHGWMDVWYVCKLYVCRSIR